MVLYDDIESNTNKQKDLLITHLCDVIQQTSYEFVWYNNL